FGRGRAKAAQRSSDARHRHRAHIRTGGVPEEQQYGPSAHVLQTKPLIVLVGEREVAAERGSRGLVDGGRIAGRGPAAAQRGHGRQYESYRSPPPPTHLPA